MKHTIYSKLLISYLIYGARVVSPAESENAAESRVDSLESG